MGRVARHSKGTRPRGFCPWQPQAKTRALLDQVHTVLAEYAALLPLTIRQIFYRLIGAYDYPKSQRDYKRLCRNLNRARRAQLVDMDAIRDDGGQVLEPFTFDDETDFFSFVQRKAEGLQLDRTKGQPVRLVVMCEAAGMAPQLERVAAPYGVPVMTNGGYDSLTDKHSFARDLSRPTEVLHIGDYDKHGERIFRALAEDVTAFAEHYGGEVKFTRLALTPEQIAQYRLPTVVMDRRRTCQAEALPPDVLAEILRTAITDRLDQSAYDRVLRQERRVRRAVMERLR